LLKTPTGVVDCRKRNTHITTRRRGVYYEKIERIL
jgi:hypothetical protein